MILHRYTVHVTINFPMIVRVVATEGAAVSLAYLLSLGRECGNWMSNHVFLLKGSRQSAET